jgi:Aromatic acid exporter family member 1
MGARAWLRDDHAPRPQKSPLPPVITMTTDFSLRPYAAPFRTAVRATARRAQQRISIARSRAQPKATFIARLTATAVFAYLLAWILPGTARSVLAPLTAVLVVQATAYQTVRSAVQRVVSVVAGVLVALAFSTAVGLTWWSLGLTIAVGLLLGSALKLGEHMLEVPISAMLILSVDTGAAASGRIVDTLVGAGAGLLGGILLSRVRTQPAEDAIGNLSRQMAGLLEEIAAGLAGGTDTDQSDAWLRRARELMGGIQRADDALGEAEDSLRLRPPALRSARTAVPLRNGLETLEHAAVTIRGLARSITDEVRLPDGNAAMLATAAPDMMADVLRQLAAALRAYGGLIRADLTDGRIPDGTEVDRHLEQARHEQARLAPVLRDGPGEASSGWPLRGEMLVHLDRLTSELQAEQIGRDRADDASPQWLTALRAARPARRHREQSAL